VDISCRNRKRPWPLRSVLLALWPTSFHSVVGQYLKVRGTYIYSTCLPQVIPMPGQHWIRAYPVFPTVRISIPICPLYVPTRPVPPTGGVTRISCKCPSTLLALQAPFKHQDPLPYVLGLKKRQGHSKNIILCSSIFSLDKKSIQPKTFHRSRISSSFTIYTTQSNPILSSTSSPPRYRHPTINIQPITMKL
jgi:hypothetical protein